MGIAELLNQYLTVEAALAINEYGEVTSYGTAKRYRCRLEHKQVRMMDVDGEEIISASQAFMGAAASVGLRDRVTLPDGTKPPIVQINHVYDRMGELAYLKVLFARGSYQ